MQSTAFEDLAVLGWTEVNTYQETSEDHPDDTGRLVNLLMRYADERPAKAPSARAEAAPAFIARAVTVPRAAMRVAVRWLTPLSTKLGG